MDNWVWIVVLGVLVLFYILIIVRQKRQEKQSAEILNSFKVGDKVVTHIGIYGKIKRIYNTSYGKVCLLEIGTNSKLEIELDMRYIAAKDEKTAVPETPTVDETKQQVEKNDEEKNNSKKSKKKNKGNKIKPSEKAVENEQENSEN